MDDEPLRAALGRIGEQFENYGPLLAAEMTKAEMKEFNAHIAAIFKLLMKVTKRAIDRMASSP